MNGVTFCKVICEKERGVVTASQTGHRLLRITLSEKNNAHFQSAIYSHTSHNALQARVQGTGDPIYDHHISPFF